MTSEDYSRAGRSELREEAARWFSVMRGPDANTSHAEFDAWLARDGAHRVAYNQIAETFSLGKRLKSDATDEPSHRADPAARDQVPKSRPVLITTLLVAAAMILGVSLLLANRHDRDDPLIASRGTSSFEAPSQLATQVGEIRTFTLADGSSVTLDTDSLLLVAFTKNERSLRLVRGRGRFSVAHEPRPFVVAAGRARITARGTLFDVALPEGNRVMVRLLRGAVDVGIPATAINGPVERPVRRLFPGDTLALDHERIVPGGNGTIQLDGNWPNSVRDFDRVRLADLLSEANRYATTPMAIAAPELGELRLSGTFRLKDTRRLTENIADLLGLAITAMPHSLVLSRTCPSEKQSECRPPS